MKTAGVAGACILLFAAMASATSAMDGASLRLLLLGMQDNNTPQTLLRADVALTVKGHDGERTTTAIVLFAPGKDARWYLQIKEPALTALVLGAKRQAMQRSGGAAETVPIGAPIGDIGISYEDLSRFIKSDFQLWQITDESRTKILVGGHVNTESAYLYRAYSIEKERKIPLKVQFYQGSSATSSSFGSTPSMCSSARSGSREKSRSRTSPRTRPSLSTSAGHRPRAFPPRC